MENNIILRVVLKIIWVYVYIVYFLTRKLLEFIGVIPTKRDLERKIKHLANMQELNDKHIEHIEKYGASLIHPCFFWRGDSIVDLYNLERNIKNGG